MPVKDYDLIALGTGTAATVSARRCRAAGWKVAVVDHRPYGGYIGFEFAHIAARAGAHVVGPEAAEIVNLFGLAMRTGLKAGDLAHATFAYPTGASDLESMLP